MEYHSLQNEDCIDMIFTLDTKDDIKRADDDNKVKSSTRLNFLREDLDSEDIPGVHCK